MNLIIRCNNCRQKNRIHREKINESIQPIKCGSCSSFIIEYNFEYSRTCPYCKGTHKSLGSGYYSKCSNCKMPIWGNTAHTKMTYNISCYFCLRTNRYTESSNKSLFNVYRKNHCEFCGKKVFAFEGEKNIKAIDNLSGLEFEKTLMALFSELGYKVFKTNAGADQGADLILHKNGKKVAVQAKRYKNKNVGNKAVQEVLAGKYFYNCDEAWVITNVNFTESAYNLSLKSNVKLINRSGLIDLINTAYKTK